MLASDSNLSFVPDAPEESPPSIPHSDTTSMASLPPPPPCATIDEEAKDPGRELANALKNGVRTELRPLPPSDDMETASRSSSIPGPPSGVVHTRGASLSVASSLEVRSVDAPTHMKKFGPSVVSNSPVFSSRKKVEQSPSSPAAPAAPIQEEPEPAEITGICDRCRGNIYSNDDRIVEVCGKLWHEDHFLCHGQCGHILKRESVYMHENNPYCKVSVSSLRIAFSFFFFFLF